MRRKGWLWGGLLAIACAGATGGAAAFLADGGAGPPPEPLDLSRLEGEERPELLPLPDDFVADLPPVPTLPPGLRARRGERDASERKEQDDLAREMRLLREARRALVTGEPAAAYALLEQHRARFPQGALREEREAYAIRALTALGRNDEAERRYLDFVIRYPQARFRPLP
jgi:hypothetical protein